ncbi:LCP family protein [Streptomyces sp. NPDC006368]|uniref:LCP family protein n=1 Tax=Streptomyces sp. NPDC006368 TaxID=3156760 RepID=UPI00339EF5A0
MAEQGSSSRIRATGRRRKQPAKGRGALTVAAWSAAGLVVIGGSGAAFAYFKLNGNIETVDINAQLRDDDRPENVDNGSMDILVLGSDTRSGANGAYGRDEGAARSDTAMIVHVYEGHRTASVVSVPRDTIIERPDCTDRAGAKVPAQRKAMFNTAYEVGGPACAVKTVEAMSGIRMDHYIEVDFTGFKKLIDELGGVRVTTTKAIKDDSSHLDLEAGAHTLTGEQALGLVRTRKGVGDGSDLGRIQLQQAFMKAFINQVKSAGALSSPKRLWDVADTATQAIKPDSELDSVKELAGFAGGFKNLGADDVRMITLPVRYDPADLNRVIPLKERAQQVWTALRQDRPIPASATEDTATGQAEGVVE